MIETRAAPLGIEVIKGQPDDLVPEAVFGAIFQYPGTYGHVRDFTDLIEKPKEGQPTSPYYNAGIYAFSPEIYQFTANLELSPRGEYELTDAIAALVRSGRRMQAVELGGDWADVRDPEVLAELNEDSSSS